MSSKKPVKKQPRKQVSSWVIFFISLAIIVALVAVIKFTGNPKPIVPDQPTVFTPTHRAEIVLEDYGTIKLDLDGNAAPITVANFAELSNSGFYDGLAFHRIIEGFMMQGGDPLGNGYGDSGQSIKGEFVNNGVPNTLSHTRGAISMARSAKYDSASCQFFIVHQDATEHLDGDYACFGYVTEGMDIVDKICTEATPMDSNGLIMVEQRPRIQTIKVEPIE